MTITDPVGDMLTRIRNALMRKHSTVSTPASKLREGVLNVLIEEGYIRGFTRVEEAGNKASLDIELKYFDGTPVITKIKRVSKPGRRVYTSIKDLTPVRNGLGISIVSTPNGVLSDDAARKANVGGEVIAEIY